MNIDLQTILIRDNPWVRDPGVLSGWLTSAVPEDYIPREAAAGARWGEAGRAHLVIGPRQAGKSTMLRAWLASLGAPALVIDCEQRLVQDWCRSAPLFLDELESLLDPVVPLLFDEVQHLDEAGLFLKGLVDRRYPCPILVTGSSSWHLGAGTRESLAGRATRTRLLPFSLAEVSHYLADRPGGLRERITVELLARHLVRGGYPEVWLSRNPVPLLLDLVDAFVVRDASDLFRIDRPELFRRLMQLVAGQVGQLVNYAEWSALLGLSRPTVASYLAILEEAHVVQTVPPFAGGKRSELTKRPQVFMLDCGLRNQLLGDLRPFDNRTDRGPLLENWVFTELAKALPPNHTLHFWRSTSGAEVDFVVAGPGRLLAVEVKASRLGRPKLPRAARSFIEAYSPERLVVVNLGFSHQDRVGETDVLWRPPHQLRQTLWG
jgi:predicted AAA+ superfamily ATPase